MKTQGILLINLGSPDSPSTPDVRRYLREFLMDKRVIDAPWPVRFGIVHFAILPTRPKLSGEAYHSIWTDQGSPLIAISRALRDKIRERTDLPVELAMRYQNPSVESAVAALSRAGVNEIILVPLFPHYAMSSYETAVEKVNSVLRRRCESISLKVLEPYYSHPAYLNALVETARPFLERRFDHLLFSFHGLPERHLRKADPTKSHCLKVPNCCEIPSPARKTCYRAQCFATVREFARATGMPPGKYSVAFQSRLGKEPWMQPYTDVELTRLAQSGVKKLLVICPAFVADCLETLEEIGMRGKETFIAAGGESFTMIPCLNDNDTWASAILEMISALVSRGPATAEISLEKAA